jgi:biopolymer transport protein ExbB/TolQ
MSLLDIILGQKIILLTLGIALVPLLAAVLLSLIAHLRRYQTKRAVRRKLAAALRSQVAENRRQTVQESDPEEAIEAALTRVERSATPRQAVEDTPQPDEEESEPDEETEAVEGEVVSSAMQDLLTSVFGEDDDHAQYEVLLEGLEPVSAADLAALSQKLLNELRAGHSE